MTREIWYRVDGGRLRSGSTDFAEWAADAIQPVMKRMRRVAGRLLVGTHIGACRAPDRYGYRWPDLAV